MIPPYTQAIHAAGNSETGEGLDRQYPGDTSNRVEGQATAPQGGGRQHAPSTLHAGTFEDLLAAANQALHPQPSTLDPQP